MRKIFHRAMLSLLLCGLLAHVSFARQTPPQNWTAQERQQLLTYLHTSLDSLENIVQPLSENQFFYVPDDSTWSVAQVVEHLSQIEEGYIREYFVVINTPQVKEDVSAIRANDSQMLAYATSPEKSKARGTNLPLNRYCKKADALRILEWDRAETQRIIKSETRDLRLFYTYRKLSDGKYTPKDMHQHFLLLVAHMQRHTHQVKMIIASAGFPDH